MRVFITGATGFIGSYVAHRLLEAGHDLVAIARNPDKTPSLSRHPRVERVPASLYDFALIREKLAGTWDARAMPSGHTYSGHPMCVAAGLATVRAYKEEKLFDRANEIEGWLKAGLAPIAEKHRIVGEARGVGIDVRGRRRGR